MSASVVQAPVAPPTAPKPSIDPVEFERIRGAFFTELVIASKLGTRPLEQLRQLWNWAKGLSVEPKAMIDSTGDSSVRPSAHAMSAPATTTKPHATLTASSLLLECLDATAKAKAQA